MTFADDERGQPVVIGALLIFTILILAFAGYQAFAVPQQNAEVEFNHFQDVQSDFAELETSLINAVESGDTRSASIDLGPQYPSRMLALNPPPAAGSLRTTEPAEVSIIESGSSVNVCRGSGTPTSRSLVYRPGYAEFDNANSIVYENRFTGRQFREGNVFGEQRLVQSVSGSPDRINLLLLTGEVSDNGVGVSNLEIEATSRYSTTVTNPTITLPSEFSEDDWNNDILAERGDATATNNGSNQVDLAFSGGDYRVSCAVAGLNSEPEFTPPATANNGGDGNDVGTGGSEEWSSSDTTRTISTEGGLWRNIGDANSVVLSNPRLSPIRPSGGESRRENRYFRIAVTIGDPPRGDRRYVLVFSDSKDGVRFSDQDGDGTPEFDSNREVRLLQEDASGFVEVFSERISESAVNSWYQSGTELNLLNPDSYENPNNVRSDLMNVRSYLESNSGQEAFISDITGRVGLTLENRNINPGGSGSPTFSSNPAVTDNSNVGSGGEADYSVQYSVDDPNGNFSEVRMVFDCISAGCTGGADETKTSGNQADTISYTSNNNDGEEWEITAKVIDDSGTETDTYTVTDSADGTNP